MVRHDFARLLAGPASAGLVKLLREEGCKVKRKVEVEKFTGVNHFVRLKCFYHFDF